MPILTDTMVEAFLDEVDRIRAVGLMKEAEAAFQKTAGKGGVLKRLAGSEGFAHGAEIVGLGALAAPHAKEAVTGKNVSSKTSRNTELAGLGILAVPSALALAAHGKAPKGLIGRAAKLVKRANTDVWDTALRHEGISSRSVASGGGRAPAAAPKRQFTGQDLAAAKAKLQPQAAAPRPAAPVRSAPTSAPVARPVMNAARPAAAAAKAPGLMSKALKLFR